MGKTSRILRRMATSGGLAELALALRQESYQPDPPVRRVFIPKANGKLGRSASRPCGSVCMTATMCRARTDLRSRSSTRTVRVPSKAECPTGGSKVGKAVPWPPGGPVDAEPRGLLRKHPPCRAITVGSAPISDRRVLHLIKSDGMLVEETDDRGGAPRTASRDNRAAGIPQGHPSHRCWRIYTCAGSCWMKSSDWSNASAVVS